MLYLLCSILTPHNVQMGGLSRGSCADWNGPEHCRVHPPVCIDSFPRKKLIRSVLTTFSTPYIKSIYFLRTEEGAKYGSFGYCQESACTGKVVGYDNGPEVTEWLTKTQVLFGIGELVGGQQPLSPLRLISAAIFMLLSFIALLLSLLRVGKFMWNPVYFRTTAVSLM